MRILLFLFALTGCANWPASQGPEPWPQLLPAAELYASVPTARQADAAQLAARARALRARAAILRRPATSRDQMEALRARLPR